MENSIFSGEPITLPVTHATPISAVPAGECQIIGVGVGIDNIPGLAIRDSIGRLAIITADGENARLKAVAGDISLFPGLGKVLLSEPDNI